MRSDGAAHGCTPLRSVTALRPWRHVASLRGSWAACDGADARCIGRNGKGLDALSRELRRAACDATATADSAQERQEGIGSLSLAASLTPAGIAITVPSQRIVITPLSNPKLTGTSSS